MESAKDAKTQIKTKKRIAPEKEADLQGAIPEDIIAASFENGSECESPCSTAGVVRGGITINICNAPMVHAQQVSTSDCTNTSFGP